MSSNAMKTNAMKTNALSSKTMAPLAITKLRSDDLGFEAALQAKLAFEAEQDAGVENVVEAIIKDVRSRGDQI